MIAETQKNNRDACRVFFTEDGLVNLLRTGYLSSILSFAAKGRCSQLNRKNY